MVADIKLIGVTIHQVLWQLNYRTTANKFGGRLNKIIRCNFTPSPVTAELQTSSVAPGIKLIVVTLYKVLVVAEIKLIGVTINQFSGI